MKYGSLAGRFLSHRHRSSRPSMPVFTGLDPRRICVIKPSALGDVVQALPVLGPLRDRFPQASVSWVINRGLAGLIDGHPHIDEVIAFDRRGGATAWWNLLKSLRSSRFDLVLDLQGLLRTGVMTRATGAGVRIGLQTAREGSHRACTAILEGTGRDVPARLRYWRIVDELFRGEGQQPGRVSQSPANSIAVPLRPADRAFAAARLNSLPRPLLAVCPGARWKTKRWPTVKFAALAARSHREFGTAAVILGGPDEQPLCSEVERHLRELMPAAAILNLAGATTLRQLAAVLEASTWAVTNDSGPMHLADAVGTPVLGLFTCTSPWLSGPPLDRHELISTRMSCAAGYHKSCPLRGVKHQACLSELDVDRAWAGLVRLAMKSKRVAA
jgi:lipopolysaccharide heptosyltransferase II